MFDSLQTLDFDVHKFYDVGLFNASLDLTLNLNKWSMDIEKSQLRFNSGVPHIQLTIKDFSCDFSGKFDMHTSPLFYNDVGDATIKIGALNLDIGFILVSHQGIFQFETEQSSLEATGMDIKFLGTADISYALTAIMNLISTTMQKDISNYLNEAIQATLFPSINEILRDLGG